MESTQGKRSFFLSGRGGGQVRVGGSGSIMREKRQKETEIERWRVRI